jgi:hypothetical protein
MVQHLFLVVIKMGDELVSDRFGAPEPPADHGIPGASFTINEDC